MENQIDNVNIAKCRKLITPINLINKYPLSETAKDTLIQGRQAIENIFDGKDKRKIIITGPCSIHNIDEAIDYAKRLKKLSEKVKDKFLIVMRTYFEKPRTTVGWKGLINDPHLDDSYDVEEGLSRARKLLIEISEIGLPTATEFLDPLTPQYIGDLISWAAIGARTTESQTHRQMASGLSMPVGFKNNTNGEHYVATDAIKSSSSPHSFIGTDEEGHVSIMDTKGNKYGHIILRGGNGITNYDKESIEKVQTELKEAGVSDRVIVDCSHGNSTKDHKIQPVVFEEVIDQVNDGNEKIAGVMLESYIGEGNQKFSNDMEYGVSITDKCMSWETTEKIILEAYDKFAE